MNLVSLLKTIKLHESVITSALGLFVLLVGGSIVYNFAQNRTTKPVTPVTDIGTITQEAASTESVTAPEPVKQDSQPTQQTENKAGEYQVVKGDTLWNIAQTKLGDGNAWGKIAQANSIQDPRKIEVGQKLVIPEVEKIAQTESVTAKGGAETTATTDGQNTAPITSGSYQVVRGDDLWHIAIRAYGDGYKWILIAKENNLHNPDLIHSGNILRLRR